MTTGATYKAIREVTLDPSLNDGPTELSTRVIAEDGVTSKDYKLVLRKKSDNTEIEFVKADRKSTRLNSSHTDSSRMPSSA